MASQSIKRNIVVIIVMLCNVWLCAGQFYCGSRVSSWRCRRPVGTILSAGWWHTMYCDAVYDITLLWWQSVGQCCHGDTEGQSGRSCYQDDGPQQSTQEGAHHHRDWGHEVIPTWQHCQLPWLLLPREWTLGGHGVPGWRGIDRCCHGNHYEGNNVCAAYDGSFVVMRGVTVSTSTFVPRSLCTMLHITRHVACDMRSICCTWFAYNCARATWAYVLETHAPRSP